jgi:hypothetical protein
MTHDRSNPNENSSDSQSTNASSASEPEQPLTEEANQTEENITEASITEAIEPSSPLSGVSNLPTESPESADSIHEAIESVAMESVAMTDVTQHSSGDNTEPVSAPSVKQTSEPSVPRQPTATASSPSPSGNPPSPTTTAPDQTAPQSTSDRTPTVLKIVKQGWAIVLALTPILVGIGRSLWRLLLLLAKWIRAGWAFLLPRIRAVLPEGWNKLPDWAITTVAVALLVFVLWITTLLLPSKAPAKVPTPSGDRPPISAPAQPQPDRFLDTAQIAQIQEQLTATTDTYAEGLIQSVQASASGNQLTVKVSDAWYTLGTNRQDNLANDLLKRSRQLDFSDLKLVDIDNEIVARSPVVGSKMVIYSRTQTAPTPSSSAISSPQF